MIQKIKILAHPSTIAKFHLQVVFKSNALSIIYLIPHGIKKHAGGQSNCHNKCEEASKVFHRNKILPGNNNTLIKGICLLYTSDAADERSSVDLGGRRIIKK